MHKVNRSDPTHPNSAESAAGCAELLSAFSDPPFDVFIERIFGVQPAVLHCSTLLSPIPGDAEGTPYPAALEVGPLAGTDWVRQAAGIAATAHLEDKSGTRVVVVDPLDPERKRPRDEVDQAFAAHPQPNLHKRALVLADSLYQLSKKYLIAVRDPHRDDPLIEQIRQRFSGLFQCCVTTNIYLSGAAKSIGFVEHHDSHDVFAIQLQGSKRWHVGPPILNFPSHRYRRTDTHASDPSTMTVYDTMPGQVLYIPAGWRHYAEPSPRTMGNPDPHGRSVHLTMGVQVPRWIDAVEAVPHEYGASTEWLRQPLSASLNGRVCADTSRGSVLRWDASDLPSTLRRLADLLEKDPNPHTVSTPCGATLTLKH